MLSFKPFATRKPWTFKFIRRKKRLEILGFRVLTSCLPRKYPGVIWGSPLMFWQSISKRWDRICLNISNLALLLSFKAANLSSSSSYSVGSISRCTWSSKPIIFFFHFHQCLFWFPVRVSGTRPKKLHSPEINEMWSFKSYG